MIAITNAYALFTCVAYCPENSTLSVNDYVRVQCVQCNQRCSRVWQLDQTDHWWWKELEVSSWQFFHWSRCLWRDVFHRTLFVIVFRGTMIFGHFPTWFYESELVWVMSQWYCCFLPQRCSTCDILLVNVEGIKTSKCFSWNAHFNTQLLN